MTINAPLFKALLPAAAIPFVAAIGCSPTLPTESNAPLDLSQFEIVDLSHTYGEDTLYWPTDTAGFDHHELAFGPTEAGYFYSSYSLSTAEHGGTHLDAPIHFAEGGTTLDRLPLSKLITQLVVIDISAKTTNVDYRLSTSDILDWESEHGQVPSNASVLLRTGWSARWPDALAYLGDDTPGDASNLHFPSFGEDAARLLIAERQVALIGVDTASIDYGQSQDFIVHQVAGAADVPGLENATNLDKLPATGAWLIALPMKIEAGSGGPVRAVALLPQEPTEP